MNMLGELSMRLREFTVQIENLSLKGSPLPTGVVPDRPGRGAGRVTDRVTLTISKGQLASLLGTIPETLSRIFRQNVQPSSLIRVEGRDIYLLDALGLEDLAEAGKLAE
jgi:hypothetical protein